MGTTPSEIWQVACHATQHTDLPPWLTKCLILALIILFSALVDLIFPRKWLQSDDPLDPKDADMIDEPLYPAPWR